MRLTICFRLLILFGLVYLITVFTSFTIRPQKLASFRKKSPVSVVSPRLEAILNEQTPLLINITNCKIPDFQPWSFKAKSWVGKLCIGFLKDFFNGPPNCSQKTNSWSYVNGSVQIDQKLTDFTVLHMNTTAIRESGYTWNTTRCCYQLIIRVEQSLNSSNMNADNVTKYSEVCYPIKHSTQLVDADFILVTCKSESRQTSFVKREALAIAKADKKVLGKMRKWEKPSRSHRGTQDPTPPNIIILGVDTTSRLSSQRNLIKTLKVLESLGATEMKGYMKVGTGTLPNTFAFLTGYSIQEITKFCNQNLRVPMDYCPFLFKAFNRIGYLTTSLEDSPLATVLSANRTGFVKKPTDFYLRPFMLEAYEQEYLNSHKYKFQRCLGSRQVEDVLLSYLEDVLELAAPSKSPVFAHVWLAVNSHDCDTSAKYMDSLLANYIKKYTSSFENTILIFMGDHGPTYGAFRVTLQGWYEDCLPMFWMYVPPSIRKAFPEWQDALQVNSKLLTSHFDLYQTLVHLIHTFDKVNRLSQLYERSKTQRGHSLFQPMMENRTCRSAGIENSFCVCSAPTTLNEDSEFANEAARSALSHISKLLPDTCEQPTLKKIESSKSWLHASRYTVFIVTFLTDPGDFLFEATVKEDLGMGGALVVEGDVRRIDQMKRSVSCVQDSVLEKLCYCK